MLQPVGSRRHAGHRVQGQACRDLGKLQKTAILRLQPPNHSGSDREGEILFQQTWVTQSCLLLQTGHQVLARVFIKRGGEGLREVKGESKGDSEGNKERRREGTLVSVSSSWLPGMELRAPGIICLSVEHCSDRTGINTILTLQTGLGW